MSKEVDELMSAYIRAESHHAAWTATTNLLLAKIELEAGNAGMEDFVLHFPITFSGGDYHDEYVRVRFDEEGAIFVDSGDNEERASDLPIEVIFSFCQQFMNTACKFLRKKQ